ncbi:aspartate aminotransferase, cytoplasmic [Geosmithia morbida]|uniref:Aspartate aminotransferase n=1 Tax=Geosmithia morbida TaxID=1094350 RepID=A0A9P4YYG6_9HYPO|nr:aspartate aminotransferase, cytoplasmic [Geosmithia morbida]KAF4125408.1 aspartate aminotransferase, cytoplasmic [Geosmithia morbida]
MTDAPVVKLLTQLMGIPSVSEQENKIGVWTAKYLEALGYSVEMIPISEGSDRLNVYAYLGEKRESRVMLTSHMDTVPPHIPMCIKDGIIYGRGACDDKGPMAAQIAALEELRAEKAIKDGDVSLLFVVGEEKGGPGMLAANNMNLAWEAIIFGEPTEGKLATGHKGHYVFELFARGVACHSGYPGKGKSATGILVSLLAELQTLQLPTSELLGPTTFHCGKISGGVAYNVMAADAYAQCGIRVATDMAGIKKTVAEVVGKYPDVELRDSFAYPEVLLDSEFEAVSYGTDVPRLRGDHKKFLYGPGSILHAHGENEQVKVADLLESVNIIRSYLLSVTMPDVLAHLQDLPRDEAFAITEDFKADEDPSKVSLGAGVYRDETSSPWILPSVKAAKEILHRTADLYHEYLPIYGSEPFLNSARDLILGPYDVAKSNVVSMQTISGTGANHLGAAFLSQNLKPRRVFISDPSWSNHHLVWEVGGPDVERRTYPYYDARTRSLDFEGMMSCLDGEADEDDVVVLHACAHNPTGIDPTQSQWRQLAELFRRKRLCAFFDSAYQGFASGDVDADAWPVRHFHQDLFDGSATESPQAMCIAQSFSKNFGLYGERVGAFHLVLPRSTPPAGPKSRLVRLIRAEISNAPLFGSRIVHTILSDSGLRHMWLGDLRTMSTRINEARRLLRQGIAKRPGTGDWSHLTSQIGMFSYTGLTAEQVIRLRREHHVYLMLNGRASLSGVNKKNVDYVAEAISSVITSQ